MRVLDLFSGIGGFSLGLESVGFRTVAFCEIEPFCREVLAHHWPGVPIHDDIRTLRGFPVDLVCGGPPCQPHSSASRGRRRGTADARWLWPEMRRVVSESKPSWVCVENVAQFDGVALETVASDLEADGYEVGPALEIPACAVGCDHWRPRLWILGYSHSNRESRLPVDAEVARLSRRHRQPGGVGAPHGVPGRMDRLQAVGNAIVPEIAEQIGRAILQAEATLKEAGDA